MKTLIYIFILLYPFVLKAQMISTFAGSTCGYSGNGGAATAACLDAPAGGVFDRLGNLFFYEKLNEVIRKVSPLGIISTVAGTGVAGFSGDEGPATAAALNQPEWITTDALGNLFISDFSNYRIRKVDTNGIIHTIAGTGSASFSGDGGPASDASLLAPSGICVDDSGNIYVCEVSRIRKINTSGIINTIVGNGIAGFSGDGGPAIAAEFDGFFIFLDHLNDLYIVDAENYRIRKVNTTTGIINTIAGSGSPGFNGDGMPATAANMNPFCGAFDAFGNLFLADGSSRIRIINASGYISTFAGTGIMGYNGDGIPATIAQIYNPEGIAIDTCGSVYITDCENCRIRKVSFPYCGYLEVDDIQAERVLNIYPNPTNDFLSINNILTPSSYYLFNIIGAITLKGSLHEGKNSINLQE